MAIVAAVRDIDGGSFLIIFSDTADDVRGRMSSGTRDTVEALADLATVETGLHGEVGTGVGEVCSSATGT